MFAIEAGGISHSRAPAVTSGICVVRVAQSLVFCVLLSSSVVILSFFFLLVIVLSVLLQFPAYLVSSNLHNVHYSYNFYTCIDVDKTFMFLCMFISC